MSFCLLGKWICSECADQGITDADLFEDTETKDNENKSGKNSLYIIEQNNIYIMCTAILVMHMA